MTPLGTKDPRRGGDRHHRRLPVALVGFVLLAMLAVGVMPTAATATVLYPPVAGSALRTAEGFELTGTIYPEGNDTTWHFEYGTSTAYGQSAPIPDADAGSTGFSIAVSQPITGLAPDTTYHYRLVSTNAVEGTADSADRTFSTAAGTTAAPAPAPGGPSSAPGGAAESSGGSGEKVTVGGSGPKTVVRLTKLKGRSLLATTGGRTLYSLSVERRGKFDCTMASGCLEIWHPLTVSSGVVPKGPVTLGTVKRPEGQLQVTYRGLPLYTFSGDRKSGQVKGEGLKDVGTWHAAVAPGRH